MDKAIELIKRAERDCAAVFSELDETELINQKRVLSAFSENRVSARHFNFSTGYGYDDLSRDTLDKVFASVFFCEDALVRTQFASGTHAIYTLLDGILFPNDTIIFASGEPYDTMKTAIANENSFVSRGVKCVYVDLDSNGRLNYSAIEKAIDEASQLKAVYIQRSRGYANRPAILPEEMERIFSYAHKKDAVTVTDNCYGEFTRINEPSLFGSDLLVGSLIKNPGGGLAPTGGYIAGKRELIRLIENRLTVPGMGREIGSYAASYLPLYQGIFMAPHVTKESLKTAVLFARLFELLGLSSMPSSDALRSDIVQSLCFNNAEDLISFIKSIQSVSPVDGYVVPEPWDMPGYDSKVIMAAGTFIQGASIELSADAPIRKPFTAYIQGALTYAHGKIAAEKVISMLCK